MSSENPDSGDEDSFVFPKSYPKAGEKKTVIETAKNANMNQGYPILDPASTESILKIYKKHHVAYIKTMKEKSKQSSETVQKADMAIAERSQEIAKLKKQLKDVELHVEKLKTMHGAQSEENRVLKDKTTSLTKNYVSLESDYDKKFAHMNATVAKNKFLLKYVENVKNKLEAVQQEKQQLTSNLDNLAQQDQKQISTLTNKNIELLGQIGKLEASLEQHKLESAKQSEILQLEFKAKLQDQAAALEAELVAKLQDAEKNVLNLQKVNQQLSIDASKVEQRLEAELKQQKVETTELMKQHLELSTDVTTYQTEILVLTDANHQQSALIIDITAKYEQAKKKNEETDLLIQELQEAHLNTTNAMSAETSELKNKLQALKELFEANVEKLQNKLQLKEAVHIDDQKKLAEMERQKNITIFQFEHKTKQIQNVCNLLGTKRDTISTVSPRSPALGHSAAPADVADKSSDESISRIAGEISASNTTRVQSRRRQTKRPIVPDFTSDFNSDTDDDFKENQTATQPKLVKKNPFDNGNGNVSHVRPTPHKIDLSFDKLKASKDP